MKYILTAFLILPSILFANENEIFQTIETPLFETEQITEISCSPSTYTPELDSDVYWSATISSPYVVTIKWKGLGIDGLSNSVVQTSYSKAGTQSVYIEAEYNNQTRIVNCGSIEVKKPPLSVICSPSSENIKAGESVKWDASVEGGTTTPSLMWLGHDEILNNTKDSFSIKYKEPGEYPADLKVTSGNITRTVYCGNVSVSSEYGEPLRASCNANKSYSYADDIVTWKSEATGGKGGYRYTWRGTYPIEETSKEELNIKYSNPGEKYAELEVCSGSDCIITQCGTVEVRNKNNTIPDIYTNLEGACYPSSDSININESVLWTAKVNQDIPPSLFVWNGTNDLNGLRGEYQTISYKTPGIKDGSFSIRTDSGELFNFPCVKTLEVTDNDEPKGFLTILKNISMIILLSIWIILTIFVVKKRLLKKTRTNGSFSRNRLDI